MSTYEKNKARIRGRTDYPDPPLNRTLRALIASCPAHASVLDIACGSGRVLAALQDKGCDCRGIDLSPGAIAVCKAKGLDAIEGDVDSFQTNQTVHDFLLAPSDVVVFSKCLNYLREKRLSCSNCKRAQSLFIKITPVTGVRLCVEVSIATVRNIFLKNYLMSRPTEIVSNTRAQLR